MTLPLARRSLVLLGVVLWLTGCRESGTASPSTRAPATTTTATATVPPSATGSSAAKSDSPCAQLADRYREHLERGGECEQATDCQCHSVCMVGLARFGATDTQTAAKLNLVVAEMRERGCREAHCGAAQCLPGCVAGHCASSAMTQSPQVRILSTIPHTPFVPGPASLSAQWRGRHLQVSASFSFHCAPPPVFTAEQRGNQLRLTAALPAGQPAAQCPARVDARLDIAPVGPAVQSVSLHDAAGEQLARVAVASL